MRQFANVRQIAFTVFGIVSICIIRPLAAEWKEPADKKFTDAQLTHYIETAVEWSQVVAQIQQDVANAKTDVGRIAAVQNMDQRLQAVLDKHKMERAEYDWMANRALESWGALTVIDDALAKAKTDMATQAKAADDKIADAQKRLATYQDAQKSGKRVMTQEDRDSVIKSAKADQQSAMDDVKSHADEVKAAETDYKQHMDDAKAADALAASPAADVAADDRADYIAGKKNEAQSARDAAKDAQTRIDDAKKAQADAQSKADAAGLKAKYPELPQTDDEKAQVKADNDQGIQQAQNDIDGARQTKTMIAQVEAQLKTQMNQMSKDVPPENVDLMRKHRGDYEKVWKAMANGGAATQPGK